MSADVDEFICMRKETDKARKHRKKKMKETKHRSYGEARLEREYTKGKDSLTLLSLLLPLCLFSSPRAPCAERNGKLTIRLAQTDRDTQESSGRAESA